MDVYMENLGCFPTSVVMNLKFIMVQIHLNANDYFPKFHVLELPKLPYTIAGLLTPNQRTFS